MSSSRRASQDARRSRDRRADRGSGRARGLVRSAGGLRETERFEGVSSSTCRWERRRLRARELHLHEPGRGLSRGSRVRAGRGRRRGRRRRNPRLLDPDRGRSRRAVSRDSFEPVYVRVAPGETPALNRIVSYETVDAGSAPLEAPASRNLPADVAVAYGSEIELADAAQLLGREAVWAGTSVNGLALESVREIRVPAGDGEASGLSLVYGSPQDGPHAEITRPRRSPTG